MTGYIPTALVALTIIDAERLCDRLNAKLGFSRVDWTALAARSIDGMTGYIPTALVALTIIDAERLCDRLNAKLGFSRVDWTALAARSMRDERPQPGDRTAH